MLSGTLKFALLQKEGGLGKILLDLLPKIRYKMRLLERNKLLRAMAYEIHCIVLERKIVCWRRVHVQSMSSYR